MGKLYKAECSECEYEKELFLGTGFMDSDVMNVISSLSESDRKEIETLLSSDNFFYYEIDRKLAYCYDCNGKDRLFEAIIVKMTMNNGIEFIFGNTCPECGKPLTYYDENKWPSDMKCPECKKGTLSIIAEGNWD